jgi:hypothetical protein
MVSRFENPSKRNCCAIKVPSSAKSTATNLNIQRVFGGKKGVVKIGDIGRKILRTVLAIFYVVLDSLLSRWVSVSYLYLQNHRVYSDIVCCIRYYTRQTSVIEWKTTVNVY